MHGPLAVYDPVNCSRSKLTSYRIELDDFGRGLRAGPALQQDEGGDEFGGRGSGREIEVHLDRDGVARGGGGEVGWEVEAKHGCGAKKFRE